MNGNWSINCARHLLGYRAFTLTIACVPLAQAAAIAFDFIGLSCSRPAVLLSPDTSNTHTNQITSNNNNNSDKSNNDSMGNHMNSLWTQTAYGVCE